MKCPCKQCICIPICQSKNLWELVEECTIASKYLYVYDKTSKVDGYYAQLSHKINTLKVYTRHKDDPEWKL